MYTSNKIEDLIFFSYDVRNGNTYIGKTVKLGTNLDFSSSKSYVDAFRTDYFVVFISQSVCISTAK